MYTNPALARRNSLCMTDSLETPELKKEDEEEVAEGEGGVARSFALPLSFVSFEDERSETELILPTKGASEDKSTLNTRICSPPRFSLGFRERGARFQSFAVADCAPTHILENVFFLKKVKIN